MSRCVTFQVIEGIDKGRLFRELPIPVTIGREEGNQVRLNDERVSRFHAKVQLDNGDVILTDLESTNGTRVNGAAVHIRRLRPGDRVAIGRTVLRFGSDQEIATRIADLDAAKNKLTAELVKGTATLADATDYDAPKFEIGAPIFEAADVLPPLPLKLGPAQVARLAEILDFIHAHLTSATENVQANEEGTEVLLSFLEWQKILAVQMILARYHRAIAEPEGQELN